MDVKEEGTAVVLSARALNFIGADITAASAGSGIANVTVTGGGASLPVTDTTGIAKGSVDATKIVRLECDTYISTSTTRVLTIPDQDVDLRPTDGTYQAPVGDLSASVSVTGSTDYVAVDINGTGHRKVLLDNLGLGGGGGSALTIQAISADATATSNTLVVVDSSGGAVVVTLPLASTMTGEKVVVKARHGEANAVSVSLNDADSAEIDANAADWVLNENMGSVTVVSDGSDFWITG